ncbi:iron ABC transporter permease, partial [Rhizobium leguminosarum]
LGSPQPLYSVGGIALLYGVHHAPLVYLALRAGLFPFVVIIVLILSVLPLARLAMAGMPRMAGMPKLPVQEKKEIAAPAM